MARLKDLPNELILRITLFLDTSVLLSFALLSKRIYHICDSQLSVSQSFHKAWKYITLSYKWDSTLVDLLLDIFDEPECVRFVRECGADSRTKTPPTGQNVIHQGETWNRKRDHEQLRDSLEASPLVCGTSFKKWMAVLNKIDQTPITTTSYPPYRLIWSLLPDLHTIEIPAKVRHEISWLCRSPLGPKLKRVHFGRSTGYEVGRDDDVAEILRLPNLRELNVTTIRMYSSPIMSHVPRPKEGHCPLERLVITSTPLTSSGLDSILQHIHKHSTRGLHSFTYRHHQLAIGPFYTEFNGPALIGALAAHTHHSLTELHLAIDNTPPRSYYGISHLNRFCTSRTNIALGRGLREFRNLQRLTVAAEMLVEGWRMKEVRESDETNRSRARLVDDIDHEVQQISLGEVLPLSLRVLKLTSEEGYEESQRVVLGKLLMLLDCWYYKVPFLRVLELGWWPEGDQLRLLLLTFCDRLGVELMYDLDSN